tara:strand:+ start:81 stop:323 length:243 start_codon:yes stop_codon:yes gene_type:complete
MKSTVDDGIYIGDSYTIREVYSDKPNCKITDKGVSWSGIPMYPVGGTQDELKADMEMMAKAFELPVLNEDEWEAPQDEKG